MLKKLVNRVLDDSVEPNIMTVKKIESVLADGVPTTQTRILNILNIEESSLE